MIFEKYIDSFKMQVYQPVLGRVYLVHLSLVTLSNQKFRNATIFLIIIVTPSIYYGSSVCSYYRPYINSGFCGFHELYGYYDLCDNISFYKSYCRSYHSRCGYHSYHSCHKNHGHCNIYDRFMLMKYHCIDNFIQKTLRRLYYANCFLQILCNYIVHIISTK